MTCQKTRRLTLHLQNDHYQNPAKDLMPSQHGAEKRSPYPMRSEVLFCGERKSRSVSVISPLRSLSLLRFTRTQFIVSLSRRVPQSRED